MRVLIDQNVLESMRAIKAWLRQCEVARTVVAENCGCLNEDTLDVLIEENVII